MSDVPNGLILLFLFPPLILTEIWLIYMVHVYTEKAEVLLPKSSFVDANRKAYSQAGFIGKVMRNGFLTLVLAMPGLCVRRGVLNSYDATTFPKGFKRMLFLSWGLGFLFFAALMLFGGYIKFIEPTV